MNDWLNYHHLLYFLTVAREGGIAPAARLLRLSAPTVSAQVKALSDALGEPLLVRKGRGIGLTDAGRMVERYASEIFSLGREMVDAVKDRPTGRPLRLSVGITDSLGKRVALRLLLPALTLPIPVRLIATEGEPTRLLAELASHALDVVLADSPVPSGSDVKAYSHLLGEAALAWLAIPRLVKERKRSFPESLDGAPVLLPSTRAAIRRPLDRWLRDQDVSPRVVAELDDSALLEALGRAGLGYFPGNPGDAGFAVLGPVDGVRERWFAWTVERRIRHPAVQAIEAAHPARAS